jgi:hypothetical protein
LALAGQEQFTQQVPPAGDQTVPVPNLDRFKPLAAAVVHQITIKPTLVTLVFVVAVAAVGLVDRRRLQVTAAQVLLSTVLLVEMVLLGLMAQAQAVVEVAQ